MAFSQSDLVGEPVLAEVNRRLRVSWSSTKPAGTYFQVYVNARLAWSGTSRVAVLPLPRSAAVVEVGSVAAGEARTDFSASLPAADPCRALLSWEGGLWQSPGVVGFRVYGSASAGATIDFSRPLATVPVTTAGVDLSGFGLGGFGRGGFGLATSNYSWRSGRLAPGVWQFAVVPYDAAGNADGAPATVAYTSAAPPRPPAAAPGGARLTYSLLPGAGFGFGSGGFGDAGFGESAGGFGDGGFGGDGFGGGPSGDPAVLLSWLPSPGD